MSDLWLMVALVVALLIGNLWLLKRNSKQQVVRKSTVSRQAQPAQAAAAVQTSPVIATTDEKNHHESATAKTNGDGNGQSSADSENGAN